MEITHYPTIIYYAQNNRMYHFHEEKSQEAFERYITKNRWKNNIRDGRMIPVQVNHVKRYYNILT